MRRRTSHLARCVVARFAAEHQVTRCVRTAGGSYCGGEGRRGLPEARSRTHALYCISLSVSMHVCCSRRDYWRKASHLRRAGKASSSAGSSASVSLERVCVRVCVSAGASMAGAGNCISYAASLARMPARKHARTRARARVCLPPVGTKRVRLACSTRRLRMRRSRG
eukprot:IDg17101t1